PLWSTASARSGRSWSRWRQNGQRFWRRRTAAFESPRALPVALSASRQSFPPTSWVCTSFCRWLEQGRLDDAQWRLLVHGERGPLLEAVSHLQGVRQAIGSWILSVRFVSPPHRACRDSKG